MGLDEQWRIDLRKFFEECDPEIYQISKAIIIHLLDRVFAKIDEKEDRRQNIKKIRDDLLGKKRRIDRHMKEIKNRSAVKKIRDEILDRVVREMAFETVKENMFIAKKIDYKMVDILVRALQLEKDSGTNADDLKVLASNVENDTLVAAKEALMNQFQDVDDPKKEKLNATFEERLFEVDNDDPEEAGPVLDPTRSECFWLYFAIFWQNFGIFLQFSDFIF